MAHHFREPERRQPLLLPADMRDWLPQGDIVHLIVDAVAMMDLSEFEASAKLGRAGQAPFAPQVLLALLLYAYSHGVRSSRVIERLCGRDAGYRFIVGDAIPDHTVIARFRQRHVARMRDVFLMCCGSAAKRAWSGLGWWRWTAPRWARTRRWAPTARRAVSTLTPPLIPSFSAWARCVIKESCRWRLVWEWNQDQPLRIVSLAFVA